MSENTNVIATTDAGFMIDVIEASDRMPIVLDFWSETCGPCRTMAPVLEELAAEYEGKFRLVTANVNDAQVAASQLGVQSIPAVFAVYKQAIVDGFSGALPIEALREWVDGFLARNRLLSAVDLLETDPAAAEEIYRKALEESPNEDLAIVGVGKALYAQDKHDECREYITKLQERGFLEPELEPIKAALDLEQFDSVDLDEARKAVADKPDDLTARVHLAQALIGAGQPQAAMDECLFVVEKDKEGVGQQARELMLDIFKSSSDPDLVREYRRKLSSLLF